MSRDALERRYAEIERRALRLGAGIASAAVEIERTRLAVYSRFPGAGRGDGAPDPSFCTLPESDLVIAGIIRQAQTAYPGYSTIWTGTAAATYLGGLVWHAECAGLYNIGFGSPRRISLRFRADAASIPFVGGAGGFFYCGAEMRIKAVAAATGEACEIDAATGGWLALTNGHTVQSCSPLDLDLAGRSPGSPSQPGYNPYYGILTVTE